MAEPAEPQISIAVRTYNYAAVPDAVLHSAEQLAEEIFGPAGIVLVWIDCPVSDDEIQRFPRCTQMHTNSGALTLKILPESMAARFRLSFYRFGLTIQGHASFVFYTRVQQLVTNMGFSARVVLGQVIVHELGHLLLGAGQHSDRGIMREDLNSEDFRQAEKGTALAFTAEQQQRMRARVSARTSYRLDRVPHR